MYVIFPEEYRICVPDAIACEQMNKEVDVTNEGIKCVPAQDR